MSTGKYAPREYAPDPNRFLATVRAPWPPPPDDRIARARTRAARIQAIIATRVQDMIGSTLTRSVLAERTGWTREKLSRVLNGNIAASLDDLMLLLDAVGLEFENVLLSGSLEQRERHRHLSEVHRYLREQQQRVAEEIAEISRARRAT